jgi:hypothetical protein
MVLIALLGFLGGCGGDDEAADNTPPKQDKANTKADPPVPQDTTEKDDAPSADKASKYSDDPIPGLTVSQRDVYEEAKTLCGLSSPRAVAADFGLNTTDPGTIAQRYARGYQGTVKQAAFDGCYTALLK